MTGECRRFGFWVSSRQPSDNTHTVPSSVHSSPLVVQTPSLPVKRLSETYFIPSPRRSSVLYPAIFSSAARPSSESAKQRMSFVKLSIFGTSFEVRSFSCLVWMERQLIGSWLSALGWEGHDSICRPSAGRNGYVSHMR